MFTNREISIQTIFINIIIIITGILTILRIIFYLPIFSDNDIAFLRDVDYRIFFSLNRLGVIEFHSTTPTHYGSFYLYFWYFIFFPFSIIPIEIGVYIWDIARLIAVIYIFKNINRISNNKKNIIMFLILCTLGYFADAYLNNSNWLVGLLLFVSYIELKKEKKWISGILFALTLYKLSPILFPIVLLIVKKIKLKDIIYFVIPTLIICLPYIIFPEYFWNFVFNLTLPRGIETTLEIIKFLRVIVMAFQTAHLIFFGFLTLIFLENLKNPKLISIFRIILFSFLLFIGTLAPLFAMLIFG
ncbi:MAG: glycosyltransferase 87 family protein [Promethearchaeota archaeon]